MTDKEINVLWADVLKCTDPTAGNTYIRFARALLAQPLQPASVNMPITPSEKMCEAINGGYDNLSAFDKRRLIDKAQLLYASLLKFAQPVQPVHQNNALIDAIDAVLSNQEHAFSGGMCHYQKGSQTWQVYEDLRIAQYNIAQPVQPAAAAIQAKDATP